MNENINLCEILKDCPEGTEFWSDNFGKVWFKCVNKIYERPIFVKRNDGYNAYYTKEGWCSIDFPASCLLWPSKDCRDWSKFTAPWYKKEKFDPNTLQPFDKVIVRGTKISEWRCDFLSHIIKSDDYDFYICVSGGDYKYCVPYNDETKHLIGTIEEAPEFYHYWEDCL